MPVDGRAPTIFQLIPTPLAWLYTDKRPNGILQVYLQWPIVRQIAPDGTITDLDFSVDGSRAAAVAGTTSDLTVSTDSGSIFQISVDSGTRTLFASGFTQPTGMVFGRRGSIPMIMLLPLCSRYSEWRDFPDLGQWGCDAIRARCGNAQLHGFPNYQRDPIARRSYRHRLRYCDTTATLNGTVNPSGSETTYHFEYGLTTSYGSTTTITSAGSGFTAVPVSAALTGLIPGMLYHFRLTATNSAEQLMAQIPHLLRETIRPGAAHRSYRSCFKYCDTTVTLNGTVNPAGSETTYQFEYGLTTAYGSNTTSASAGSGLQQCR